MLQLQIELAKDCVNCAEMALRKEYGGAIVCLVTAAAAAIVRHFEKRKLTKELKKKQVK